MSARLEVGGAVFPGGIQFFLHQVKSLAVDGQVGLPGGVVIGVREKPPLRVQFGVAQFRHELPVAHARGHLLEFRLPPQVRPHLPESPAFDDGHLDADLAGAGDHARQKFREGGARRKAVFPGANLLAEAAEARQKPQRQGLADDLPLHQLRRHPAQSVAGFNDPGLRAKIEGPVDDPDGKSGDGDNDGEQAEQPQPGNAPKPPTPFAALERPESPESPESLDFLNPRGCNRPQPGYAGHLPRRH